MHTRRNAAVMHLPAKVHKVDPRAESFQSVNPGITKWAEPDRKHEVFLSLPAEGTDRLDYVLIEASAPSALGGDLEGSVRDVVGCNLRVSRTLFKRSVPSRNPSLMGKTFLSSFSPNAAAGRPLSADGPRLLTH